MCLYVPLSCLIRRWLFREGKDRHSLQGWGSMTYLLLISCVREESLRRRVSTKSQQSRSYHSGRFPESYFICLLLSCTHTKWPSGQSARCSPSGRVAKWLERSSLVLGPRFQTQVVHGSFQNLSLFTPQQISIPGSIQRSGRWRRWRGEVGPTSVTLLPVQVGSFANSSRTAISGYGNDPCMLIPVYSYVLASHMFTN